MRRRSDDWRFLARGELAAEDLLAQTCGVSKAKVGPKILTRDGFDTVVRRLIGKLASATGPADERALRAAAKKLDRNWGTLGAAERNRVIKAAAAGLLEVPHVVAPKVAAILQGELADVVQAAKVATHEKWAKGKPPPIKTAADVNRLGVKNTEFLREPGSMRDMANVRAAYAGATPAEANEIATGRAPARNSGKILDPVKITIDSGEAHLEDGRHRLLAATEAGAIEIRAVVASYDADGNKIRGEPTTLSIAGEPAPPMPTIAAEFSAADRRVVEFAAKSQGSYITDQYGQRAVAYEQRARDIVSAGMERGLGREDIARELGDKLTTPMLARSASYWDQVASIHVARARSYGQLAGYDDAGIERYVISASGDEVTCVICRCMNGKEFSTAASLARYRDVEASRDHYAVESLQPFVQVGRGPDGKQYLFADAGGKQHFIAEVLEDATGERDNDGRYGRQASETALQTAGVSAPPFHGRCRCLTEPA